MKLRLNKKVMAEMPDQVRALVQDWKDRWHKANISVQTVTQFCPSEDAKVVVINLLTTESKAVRVAGEWAGMTELSPTATVPLPEGCVAVVSGIFLGHPWLTLYQGGKPQLAGGAA